MNTVYPCKFAKHRCKCHLASAEFTQTSTTEFSGYSKALILAPFLGCCLLLSSGVGNLAGPCVFGPASCIPPTPSLVVWHSSSGLMTQWPPQTNTLERNKSSPIRHPHHHPKYCGKEVWREQLLQKSLKYSDFILVSFVYLCQCSPFQPCWH